MSKGEMQQDIAKSVQLDIGRGENVPQQSQPVNPNPSPNVINSSIGDPNGANLSGGITVK